MKEIELTQGKVALVDDDGLRVDNKYQVGITTVPDTPRRNIYENGKITRRCHMHRIIS